MAWPYPNNLFPGMVCYLTNTSKLKDRQEECLLMAWIYGKKTDVYSQFLMAAYKLASFVYSLWC